MENSASQFKEYANTQDKTEARDFYEDIAAALADKEFLDKLRCRGYDNILNQINNTFGTSVNVYNLNSHHNNLERIHLLYTIHKLEDKIDINSLKREVKEMQGQLRAAKSNVDNIKKISGILSGTEMLEAYAKDFDNEAKEHEKKARHWLRVLILSVVGLIVLTTVLLCMQLSDFSILERILANDLKEDMKVPRIVSLAIKGGIVTAYAQIPLFLKKNYYAERHLEQANIHRRNVLRSLHAIYDTVSEAKERDKLLVVGATVAFSEPESGFITRKEGAGNDNSSIESILKSLT